VGRTITERGARGSAVSKQVEPAARRRVDRHHGLPRPEALDRARDLLDRAGRVERRDQLHPLGAAALVQRDELLVGRLARDVDAAVTH
jgi:hypothetical protein